MGIDPVSLAITVALNAAMMAVTAARKIEGPRLTDLSVTVADYGTPMNYLVGTRRLELPCFYAEPMRERKRRRKTKSGKYAEYTYFGTWASLAADMQIASVDAVYFDRHPIYDRITGDNLFELNEDYDLADNMRFYLGTEDQEADPRMLATVEDEEGPGMCPAYLGVAYIFFEDVPLEKLGNRFPQVSGVFSADIPRHYSDYSDGPSYIEGFGTPAYEGTPAFYYQADLLSPSGKYGAPSVYNDQIYLFDFFNRDLEWLADITHEPDYTNTEIELVSGHSGFDPMAVDDEGSLWGTGITSGGGFLIEVPRATHAPSVAITWPADPEHPDDGDGTGWIETFTMPDGSIRVIWVPYGDEGALRDQHKFYMHNKSAPGTRQTFDTRSVGPEEWFPTWFFQDENGDLWCTGSPRVVNGTLSYFYIWRFTDESYSSNYPEFHTVTGLPAINTAGAGFNVNQMHARGYMHEGAFVGGWVGRSGALNNLDIGTLVRFPLDGAGTPTLRTLTGYWRWASQSRCRYPADYPFFMLNDTNDVRQALQVDPETLEDIALHNRDDWGAGWLFDPTLNDDMWLDLYNPGIYAFNGHTGDADITGDYWFGGIRLYFVPVAADRITLGDVCKLVTDMAGMEDSQRDFSALDQRVKGYSWTQGAVKDVIGPLLELHDSDIRPHGYIQEGLKRGRPLSGAPLETEWFVSIDDGALYVARAAGDTDLPRRVFCVYADINSEQQANTAVAQRNAVSVATLRELTIDLTTCAMTADEVQPYVERFLRRQYIGAVTVEELKLTPRELALEPGDVRLIELDGELVRGRATRVRIAPNRMLTTFWQRDGAVTAAQIAGAEWSDDAGTTISETVTSPGAEAVGRPDPSVYSPVDSRGFVLDLPLLSDTHDQSVPFVYIGGGPVEDGDWPGVDIWQSDTGASDSYASGWDGVGNLDPLTWGTSPTIGTVALATVIDNGTELVVELAHGELESVTEAEIIADKTVNLAVWGSELIQFRDAVLQSDGEYILTGLVRGVQGTEQHIGTQYPGDRFILLDTALHRHDMGAGELGDTDYYKAQTIGLSIASVAAEQLTFEGAANKPLSPVYLAIVRDDNGDWLITWTRRTRIGGGNIDGQNVPLGETSELYRVRVLDPYTGETVRTIESTSPSATYTVAQQTVDWGGLASNLEVEIVQMSPALNLEGYPATASA